MSSSYTCGVSFLLSSMYYSSLLRKLTFFRPYFGDFLNQHLCCYFANFEGVFVSTWYIVRYESSGFFSLQKRSFLDEKLLILPVRKVLWHRESAKMNSLSQFFLNFRFLHSLDCNSAVMYFCKDSSAHKMILLQGKKVSHVCRCVALVFVTSWRWACKALIINMGVL